jgi:hypothetical protein
MDVKGNLFIADSENNRIRRVTPDGIITTVAGNGIAGYSGDGGPAVSAQLADPEAVAVDGAGNLFIATLTKPYGVRIVRKVGVSGIITTVAGNGSNGFSGDGGPAVSAQLSVEVALASNAAGDVFIADVYNNRIRKVSPDGIITTVAGGGHDGLGNGGPATNAQLSLPTGAVVDAAGNLFISEALPARIRKVSINGTISIVAGNGESGFSGDGGPATSAQLHSPNGVAVDRGGNLFISDYINGRVRQVSPDGMITSVAGNSCVISCFSGDGGSATEAQLDPWAVAVDSAGSLFVAEVRNHRVRKVSSTGVIITVAGNGTQGFSGDGGAATAAQFDSPSAVAVGTNADLFISDYMTGRVRKVSQTGIITTVAGGGTLVGPAGDGAPGTNARLQPQNIAVDSAGNLFIVEFVAGSSNIRKVAPDGIITTVAGNANAGLLWPDGATDWSPGPATDAAGNLFFLSVAPGDDNCDDYCVLSQVRRLSPDGITTTIAGTDTEGYSGDGGLATGAELNGSSDVAVDRAGNIYLASPSDEGVGAVRILRPIERPVWISAVVDAASQRANPVMSKNSIALKNTGPRGPSERDVMPTLRSDFQRCNVVLRPASARGKPRSLKQIWFSDIYGMQCPTFSSSVRCRCDH